MPNGHAYACAGCRLNQAAAQAELWARAARRGTAKSGQLLVV